MTLKIVNTLAVVASLGFFALVGIWQFGGHMDWTLGKPTWLVVAIYSYDRAPNVMLGVPKFFLFDVPIYGIMGALLVFPAGAALLSVLRRVKSIDVTLWTPHGRSPAA